MSQEKANKGLVGTLYGITVTHDVLVGEKRKHDDVEKLGKCWCWERKI